MTKEELWSDFTKKNNLKDTTYEAWQFGEDADLLSDLVVKGIKTATSSGFVFYKLENELLPKVGEYNIILDPKGEAVCIIKTIKVEVVPFCCISKEHAYKEGEGTKTLEYWRISHKDFFSKELFKVGLDFDENMKVVTEEFELVYTAK